MYRSEKRKEEFEESELSLSQRILGILLITLLFMLSLKMSDVLIESGTFGEIMKDFKTILIILYGFCMVSLMTLFAIGELSCKREKKKSKDFKVEILEINSKFKNGKISFKKALKKIRKLKKEKVLSEEEKNLREEKLKILEKESLILENNQEKSVWIEQK